MFLTESNLHKLSHLKGKMMGSDATQLLRKPMHYSSIVYFDNQFGWFFGLGVLISEKWVLTDGSLGPQISTLKMVSYYTKNSDIYLQCNCYKLHSSRIIGELGLRASWN